MPRTRARLPSDSLQPDEGAAFVRGLEGSPETGQGLLDTGSVVGYLTRRGLLAKDGAETPAKLTELGGGVSSVVLLVEMGGDRFVVKQPRKQLLVKDEWLANPERALREAGALRFTHDLTAGAVPMLFDVDAETCTLTMAAAPAAWRPWKDLLLEGTVDPSTGRGLGKLLGDWHLSSSHALAQLTGLDDLDVFDQLRIEPFHRTVASRHPELAPRITCAIESLVKRPGRCLVHGDFSPKNVLVGEEGLWVIDFEVAHVGNPVFDVAFLLAHLILKSVHQPGLANAYRGCAAEFLEGYEDGAGSEFMPSDESLALHVGCLLLARVDGKSPADYLTMSERARAWDLGSGYLHHPVNLLSSWPSSERELSR